MKCDKCSNEATVYYKASLNGKAEEYNLCADCARQMGIERAFRDLDREMDRMLRLPFGGFFAEPMLPWSFGGMGSLARMMAPVLTLPRLALYLAPAECSSAEQAEKPVEETAEEKAAEEAASAAETAEEPTLEQLKAQLEEAIGQENYEACITLRDKIRAMQA